MLQAHKAEHSCSPPIAARHQFPVKLDKEPNCDLKTQWTEADAGVMIVRYGGSDGYLYESITPERGIRVWMLVGLVSESN